MDESKVLRVVIADDEPLARQRIEDLLAKEKNVTIAATADNGREALETIRRVKPDLLFLDVQMPLMTGLDVAGAIGAESMPATIFVTAYDRFALKAFDMAAVDYLLKPFDDERFAQALARARKMIELAEVEKTTRRLLDLLGANPAQSDASAAPAQQNPKYIDRISVDSRGQTRVVPVADIEYITADGPYAELHAGKNVWAIRERMQTLEENLDPAKFIRLHRSVIARIDLIDVLLRRPGGDYAVRLKDGTELSVSRGRRDEVARAIGI